MGVHAMRHKVRACRILLGLSVLVVSAGAHSQSRAPQEIRESIKDAGGPERYLEAAGAAASKKVGQMVDAESELMSVSVTGMSIGAAYRLPNVTKAEFPNLTELRAAIAQHSAAKVCGATYASVLIGDYGAIYKYDYYSKNREYLFEFQLDRSTCAPGYHWQ
jgi:hypothetical protein